jgi:glycosyltransferase involved in cell wall biosynthesis
MKVLYVCTVERGGPLTHLRTLAPAVRDAGADVRVVVQGDAQARLFDGAGVEVDVVPARTKWDVAGAARLVAATRGADVVHTHDRRSALFTLPPARARRAATVYTYHGLPEDFAPLVGQPFRRRPDGVPWARRLWVLDGLLRIEARLAGAVVVPSQALADYLVAAGFPAARMTVLPYGIDTTGPVAAGGHEPVEVGAASILIPRKAVDVLVEACARVEHPIRLHVYGDGPQRADLEAQARRLGLDAVFHGLVPDVAPRLRDLDLFVLSTRGDNLPVAVLEAMAAGLPVIASRTGGIPEQVVDGVTGALVPPGDVGALARAIEGLAAAPEVRAAYGRAAHERAVQLFDSAEVARRMVKLYQRVACASST